MYGAAFHWSIKPLFQIGHADVHHTMSRPAFAAEHNTTSIRTSSWGFLPVRQAQRLRADHTHLLTV
jgi:hypothetical protein